MLRLEYLSQKLSLVSERVLVLISGTSESPSPTVKKSDGVTSVIEEVSNTVLINSNMYFNSSEITSNVVISNTTNAIVCGPIDFKGDVDIYGTLHII